MVPLLVSKSQTLVFDVAHIGALRELGIVGVLSGSLPKAPQQNVFLGVPLLLSPYEALWLVNSGHCCFVDSAKYNSMISEDRKAGTLLADILDKTQYVITPDSFPASEQVLQTCTISSEDFLALHSHKPRFWQYYNAFCYLRNKGYFLMPGLRFGGAFVAYPGDPLNFHSHLIVKILDDGENVNLLDIVANGRLATAVKKAWIIIDGKSEPTKADEAGCNAVPRTKAFSIEWAGFG